MIDEKKLLENLIPLLNEHGDMYFAGRIIGMIGSQPKISEWIPCSERLPDNIEDDSVQYLITVKVGKYEYEIDFGWWSKISKYDNCKKKWVDYFGWTVGNDWDEGQGMEVIAWQPLPEPYIGEHHD